MTKVEGHASLHVRIKNGVIEKAELDVEESARFFEGILKGRRYDEAHRITSRVCGICSIAHQMAALQAVEDALDVKVSEQTNLLRDLLTHGMFLQNHVIHTYFFALPDYLGYSSALEMMKDYRDDIHLALHLKKLGNLIMSAVGEREVHPITPVIGGFSVPPKEEKLGSVREELLRWKDKMWRMVELAKMMDIPDFEMKQEHFALSTDRDYTLLHGCIRSTEGESYRCETYKEHFTEYLEPYSTSKFVVKESKSFLVGPLARFNINHRFLSRDAKKVMKMFGLKPPVYNIYKANLVRVVEAFNSLDRSVEIINELLEKGLKQEKVSHIPKDGEGVGVVEAPRGLLYHWYRIKDRRIVKADIVTPTAQNLKSMEDGIKKYLPEILDRGEDEIKLELEKMIRAFDPCFSCSAHFLELRINRT